MNIFYRYLIKAWQQATNNEGVTMTVQYLQDFIENRNVIKIDRSMEMNILALQQIAAW